MPDPHALAAEVREGMYARDRAAQALGIAVDAIEPGAAVCRMTVRDDMVQGHGTFQPAQHVVAAMHDDAGNAVQLFCLCKNLVLCNERAMSKIMRLDAGDGHRVPTVGELLHDIVARMQGRTACFPQ